MFSDGTNPDRDQLRRFLLGQLDDAQHERVERWLHETPEAVAPGLGLEGGDALVDALHDLDECAETPPSPQVVGLIDRLSKLRPADATSDTLGRTPADSTGPTPPRLAGPSFLSPPQQPDEMGRLGGFRVLRVLGEGGMGLVLEAEDIALQRRIALKVMRPEIAARAESRQRFLREARTAAGLSHDHVVPVYQVGEENGVLFIAMPLLAGESLEDRLRSEEALLTGEVLRIGRETAEGLAAAHAAGLVHRDLKPSNLWLESALAQGPQRQQGPGVLMGGRVKILDFGLARSLETEGNLTDPGMVVGTPAYMSPEQAKGEALDGRSDLFSLGCVLYRMTTGQPAFEGKTHGAVLLAVMSEAPPPPHVRRPDVSRALSDLIMRLLAKDPAARPPSAGAVAAELRALETATPTSGASTSPAATISPTTGASPGWRRWRALLGLTALAAVVLAGLLTWRPWRRAGSAEGPDEPPGQPHYEGSVNITVWSKEGMKARRMELRDLGALPLRTGAQVRIEVKVMPAAYLYVFWIDAEGKVEPMYPWQPGKWGTRPTAEQPRERLELPPTKDTGYTLTGAEEGMETLLMLARPEPLGVADEEVRRLFEGLGKQRPVQNHSAAVWFENGQVVETDVRRKRMHFEVTKINDPVLRVQELLSNRLGRLASFTSAVSFARVNR